MIEPIDLWSYAILFVGVAVSWIGIPILGGAALATAGVLAGDGELNVWLVIGVAAAGAWTGGYAGHALGTRAGAALANRPGRWHPQRRRALAAGERLYGRWGPLAVFLTPTWVSGALRMPRKSFLIWNGIAALVSTVVTTFGAYAIATAVLDQVSARIGIIAPALAIASAAAAAFALYRRSGRHHASVNATDRARTQASRPVL
jgi:membrane protein DedA with SNARE-associated domain